MLCVAFTYASIRDSLDESKRSRKDNVEYLNNNAKRGDGESVNPGASCRSFEGESEVGISRWRRWTLEERNEKDRSEQNRDKSERLVSK